MIDLQHADNDEGLILIGPEAQKIFTGQPKQIYTNRTGGTIGNQSTTEGYFLYLPIPDKVKELMCCQYLFSGEAADEADAQLTAQLNLAFIEDNISFRVEKGEEAWLHGHWVGPRGMIKAIATWQNCDQG